jgi:hypothetical protein
VLSEVIPKTAPRPDSTFYKIFGPFELPLLPEMTLKTLKIVL